MELKFTFGGASRDHHDHGGAPSGIPLPFSSTPPVSTSSVLELRVRRVGPVVIADAVSGDGVVYASGEVEATGADARSLARALRSALSRAIAALEGPLAESVSEVIVELGENGAAAIAELGVPVDGSGSATVDAALQRRIGVLAGTPIRVGT